MATRVKMTRDVYDTFERKKNSPVYPLLERVSFLKNMGVVMTNINDVEHAVIDDITDYKALSVGAVAALVGEKAEVEKYPCYIKVTDTSADVPAFHPYSTDTDEEGNETQNTWDTVSGANHSPIVIGDDSYFENDSRGGFLLGSVIAQFIGAGFTVLSVPQMQDLQIQAAE